MYFLISRRGARMFANSWGDPFTLQEAREKLSRLNARNPGEWRLAPYEEEYAYAD